MLLGTDFNDKINQFAYLKNSQGDLKVINKFYTKAQILFINCCLTIAYAGVTLFRSKIHLLLQACFPNFMVGSEGSLRPIPNLDRDHINHSDKLRIFDIIKRNGTSQSRRIQQFVGSICHILLFQTFDSLQHALFL